MAGGPFSKFRVLTFITELSQLQMGCSQSEQASDPTKNPPLMRNSSGLIESGKMYQSGVHSPQNFAITMVGNTSVQGLVLGFSGGSFDPIPCRVPIPRYCHALLRDKETGFITGGIEDLESNVSAKATLDFQILQGNISKKCTRVDMKKLLSDPASALQPFPEMINARYAHCAIILEDYLYVIGGRQYGTDQNGLLSACERFDFSSRKWKALPSMQYPRAAGSVVAFGEHIYVFGGYSGNSSRTRVIQTYSDGDSSWKKLPFLLHEGYEGALVLKKPGSSNSVLIFGGKRNIERSSRVVEFNVDRSTVLGYCSMQEGRSFHKGRAIQNDIFLIGGGCESVEVYSPFQQTTRVNKDLSYLQYCTVKELNSFSQFQESIKLNFQKRAGDAANFANKVSVFGHAHQPFAYHINTDNMMVTSEGQSLAHNFYQFTNTVRVNKEYSFVMGGISCDLADVASTLYSYSILNNDIKYLQPMPTPRYAFASAVVGSYLYVIGGRKLGDDEAAILGLCERFSFQSYQWETIAPLKYRRQSATAVPVSDFILVIGGYKGNGARANQLELYVPHENRWVELDTKFQLSVEGMTPVEYQGTHYLFGGRATTDIQKVFKLKVDIDPGVKFEKCLRPQLQPVGFLSNPGTNLKVYVNEGMAFVFGVIPYGVDVYDLNKHKSVAQMPLKVFEGLSDPYFQAYTLIF